MHYLWILEEKAPQQNHEILKDNLVFGVAKLFTFKVVTG